MIQNLLLSLAYVLTVILIVALILAFVRPRRVPAPLPGHARYILFLGSANDAEDWARVNGYAKSIVIPIQRGSAVLWGLRGPIAVVGDPSYIQSLPPRERMQAREAVDRVAAINSVHHTNPGGDDAA